MDTNIVWYVDWLGPYVFDGDDAVLHSKAFQKARNHQKRDWLALSEVFRLAQRASPVFILSTTVLSELRSDRRPYGWELYQWSILNDALAEALPPSEGDYAHLAALPSHPLMSFLPDSADRKLLAEASFHMCDSFLTMDRLTIWRYRDRIRRNFGIGVVTPTEMLTIIR